MKTLKKALSLVLCLAMALALCVTAFAEITTTATLTITDPVEGHTYKVYQLLKGDVSGLQNGSATLSNVELGSSVKADYTDANAIATALKGKTGSDVGDIAYGYIDTAAGKEVATLSTNTTSATVVTGYYVIVDASYTGAQTNVVYSRYMVAVVGDTTVAPKTSKPTVDKNIVDTDANQAKDYVDGKGGKSDTAAIGDTIEYEITSTVPNTTGYTYYYYILNDTLSAGLTFNNDITVTIKSADGTKSATLTKDTDYYVYTGNQTSDNHTFEVAFKDVKGLYATYGEGAVISVKYTADVNTDAVIGGTTGNTNDVYLQYSNKPGESEQKDKGDKPGTPDTTTKDPTGVTPTYKTRTFVTELDLSKIDGTSKAALTGAEFTLTGDNLTKTIIKSYTYFEKDENGTYWKLKDGSYTTTAPITEDKTEGDVTIKANSDKYASTTDKYSEKVGTTTATEVVAGTSVTAQVDANGHIKFTGLNAGTYTLTETKTPAGYNTISPITITIAAAENGHATGELEGGSITFTGNDKVTNDNDGTFSITVENNKGDVLPSTGGMGTTIFYVIGTMLVLGAGVVLVSKKRMSKEG